MLHVISVVSPGVPGSLPWVFIENGQKHRVSEREMGSSGSGSGGDVTITANLNVGIVSLWTGRKRKGLSIRMADEKVYTEVGKFMK